MSIDPKHRGALAEQRAVVWLLEQGYEVFTNVSQHGVADLIARAPDGQLRQIDVTTAHWRPNGTLYHKKLRSAEVEYLVMSPEGQFYWRKYGDPQGLDPRNPQQGP